jgi:hypothetical protein
MFLETAQFELASLVLMESMRSLPLKIHAVLFLETVQFELSSLVLRKVSKVDAIVYMQCFWKECNLICRATNGDLSSVDPHI